jgi:type IV pilus assembly protein PilM
MSGMKNNRLLRWLVDPEPPGLGIDLRAEEMSLVRLSDKRRPPEIDLSVVAPLPPGLLRFHMLEPNILDEEGFAKALSSALLRAGLGGGKRVGLSIPDPLARIAVMELPDPPRSSAELVEFLKFRMKKSLPFDVENARVAFERIPGEAPTFLTGVMHEAVVSQYEEVFTRIGLHVGMVLPASVSLLQVLRPLARRELAPGADYFFVNAEREYFSVALVRHGDIPSLIRTLGLRAEDGTGRLYGEEDLLQEIIPTAIYYREKLSGGELARVYYRSLRPDLVRLREILEEQFEAPSEPFNLAKAIPLGGDVRLDGEAADAVAAAAGAARGKAA